MLLSYRGLRGLFREWVTTALLAWSWLGLCEGCAHEVQQLSPEPLRESMPGATVAGAAGAHTTPVTPPAGVAGSPSTAGSTTGGAAGAGNKDPSGGGGVLAATAGMAGANATGGSAGGQSSGGAAAVGCDQLPEWEGNSVTLKISQGEVITWQGKRYRATQDIGYPNAECAPDAPAVWCQGWFTLDGEC
jgi:hypothetical protein